MVSANHSASIDSMMINIGLEMIRKSTKTSIQYSRCPCRD